MKDKGEKSFSIAKILFQIFAAVMLLYFVLGETLLPVESPKEALFCEEFHSDWTWVQEDGTEVPIVVPGKYEVPRNQKMVIKAHLPEELEGNTFLRFYSLRQDMEIYVDGELRMVYTTEDTRLFGMTSSAFYVFLELDPEDAGKEMLVTVKSDSAYSGVLRSVYYGDKMGLWGRTFQENGAELVVAFLTMMLGLASIIASTLLRRLYHKKQNIEYLGWGVFLAATWLIETSNFRQLLFRNVSVASDLTFMTISLMTLPFLIYMNEVQSGRYRRLFYAMEGIVIFGFVAATTAQIAGIRDFSDTITPISVLCFFSMLLILGSMFVDIGRGHIKEYSYAAIGILGAILAGSAQIILYYMKRDVPFSGAFLSIGLLFLLTISSISTVRDILSMEKEKRDAILANESKARFLANMSHEIRTPINAVLGMDEMIIRESSEEQIVDYAKDIQSAGKSLLSLINDILDFSKIESGKMEIVPGEYHLSSLLGDCYNMIAMRAEAKNLKLTVECNRKLPNRLLGDEVRIRQIVVNFLTNAVKYTEQGQITVFVDGTEMENDRIRLKISVKDTGIGIREEDIEKLFLSFQRVEEQRNRYIEGTGLGLAITHQLVQLMDGTITVESEYGNGSMFTAEIPQTVISREPVGDFSIQDAAESEERDKRKQFLAPDARLLVVDDVAMNLKVFTGLLKHTRIQIDLAESGKECLEMVQKKQYHIIFLDHMMPEMDGIETWRVMKKLSNSQNKQTPVVMLTANAIIGAKDGYLSEGFTDYLSKPVQQRQLEEMVLKYLPEELILESIADRIDFLDTQAGICHCADNEQLYEEMLKTYLRNDKSEQLEELFRRQDWKQYEMLLRVVKKASHNIGALALWEEAAELEDALEKADYPFVREKHEQFFMNYKEILSKIFRIF